MAPEVEEARQLLILVNMIREDLRFVRQAADQARRFASSPVDEETRAAAVATPLQRFYTGLEQIFQRVAQRFDGGVPGGGDWHRQLLRQMAQEVPSSRVPVLSPETVRTLDEYRRFRHFLIHAYGAPLEWSRMRSLVERIDAAFLRTQEEIAAFLRFVEELAAQLQSGHELNG